MECCYCCKKIVASQFVCTRCFSNEAQQLVKSNKDKQDIINNMKEEINALINRENYIDYETKKTTMEDTRKQTTNQISEVSTKIKQSKLRIQYLKESLYKRKMLLGAAKKKIENEKLKNQGPKNNMRAIHLYDRETRVNEYRSQKMKLFMGIFYIHEISENNRDSNSGRNGYDASMKDMKMVGINDTARLPLKNIKGLRHYAEKLVRKSDWKQIKKFNQALSLLVTLISIMLKASYVEPPFPVPNPRKGHCRLDKYDLWVSTSPGQWDPQRFYGALVKLSQLVELLCGSNGIRVVDQYMNHPLHNLLCLYDSEFMNDMLKLPPYPVYPNEWRKKKYDWNIEPSTHTKQNYFIYQSTTNKLRTGFGEMYAGSSEGAKRDQWPIGFMDKIAFDPDGLFSIENQLEDES